MRNFINGLSWQTVVSFLLAVWLISLAVFSPAEAANKELKKPTEGQKVDKKRIPLDREWVCGKGRPLARTKSGQRYCPK